ncbi:methyltransferase domain-containing protein [Methylocapsa polymorpha]|uniref:Methyltransferase domain-containing protein n=1 Tax=Methylocapsa polymorpha TaxID=3080828 RepID=A0ABZ0HUW0_9HYPH|nr:methyltransferase domain-containing protein [Methylocapsa sp. RX1]
MAPSPIQIFDRALIRRRLSRAAPAGSADFLASYAIADLGERLGVIKRDFTAIADIGTPVPELARQLSARYEVAQIVRLSPIAEAPAAARALAFIGDEEALPLAAEHFDLAVSALALQHVNDLPGALVQIRRALKPDGLFLGCLLGGQSLHELRTALTAAETEIYGGVSPRVAPFADVRDMGGLLQRAGFALPVADSEPLTVRYADMFGLMADLRAMGATNPLDARLRRPSTRGFFLRAAQIYSERFADPDGRLRATFELIFLSGWAPHESQQKPLRPGSAKMRLADALRGAETKPQS